MMARATGLAALAALCLLVACVLLSRDNSPTELRQSSAAGFAKAAHGARSWAAMAFGSMASSGHQQQLNQEEGSYSDRAASPRPIRGSRGRNGMFADRSASLADTSRDTSFRSGLVRRNVDDVSMSSESKGFYADAMESLSPAPKLSTLRSVGRRQSFSDDAMQSLRTVRREASTTDSEMGRTAQLADIGNGDEDRLSPSTPSESRKPKFALAPEHSSDTYAQAQEFGSMIEHLREQREDQEKLQKEGYKAYEPKVERAAHKSVHRQTYDSFGIPDGSGEGFHVTEYKSAKANKKNERRVEGISSDQAQSDISKYFTNLVDVAKDKKQAGPNHHYFATKGNAREAMLSEVDTSSASAHSHARLTALHPVNGAAASSSAAAGQTVPVQSVVSAVDEIRDEAIVAEKAILREAAAAKRAIRHAKESLVSAVHRTHTDAAYSPSSSATASSSNNLNNQDLGMTAVTHEHKERFHAIAPRSSESHASFFAKHRLSGEAAREALLSSMDAQFSRTRDQDHKDMQKLHVLGHSAAKDDLTSFLTQEAESTRRQDEIDQERLAKKTSGRGVNIIKKEKYDVLRSEKEYENALRDALHNGALPHRPA